MEAIQSYYRSASVRDRMAEFMGGLDPQQATCVYINGHGPTSHRADAAYRSPKELHALLDSGMDVSRSLWDRRSLMVDLDIEYVNFDFPAEPYLEPERIFQIQSPVEDAIAGLLEDHQITCLHLFSGRGHHFQWNIERDSQAFSQLHDLGPLPSCLESVYASTFGPVGKPVGTEYGKASAGLGLVMEYLAHQIRRRAAPQSSIPVELTAVEVGPTGRGREIVSVDISEYGDPVHLRALRIPFSVYLKPMQQRQMLGQEHVDRFPYTFLIPAVTQSRLDDMRDIQRVAELAGQTSVAVPSQSESMESLIEAYEGSELAQFHAWFYSEDHEDPSVWSSTYDLTPLASLPPCIRHFLEHPNDLLLKPACIEHVVRVFLALGWHPRHIAGLIRSKYERNFNWGSRWYTYSAGTRADFYSRLFAGLFWVGLDDLVDLNCQSTREKGLCLHPDPSCNLLRFQQQLLERRENERLAHWSFDRLLFR